MIATRSHVSASTDRSCAIRIIDSPSSVRKSSRSSRICACIITSSPVLPNAAGTDADVIKQRFGAIAHLVGGRFGSMQADRRGNLVGHAHHWVDLKHNRPR
jgi:hypothetical protein